MQAALFEFFGELLHPGHARSVRAPRGVSDKFSCCQRIFNKSMAAVLCPKMRQFKISAHRTQRKPARISLTMRWRPPQV